MGGDAGFGARARHGDTLMSGSADALADYEAVALATGRMLAAARASDWDLLIEQESQCAALVEALRAGAPRHDLDERSLVRKAALIRRILADDAEIRRLTQPWLRRMEDLLRVSINGHRLGEAYRQD